MKEVKPILLPKHQDIMKTFGNNILSARIRRNIPGYLFAERVNVPLETLMKMEEGDYTIAIGHYFNALRVLGLHLEFENLGSDEILSNKLREIELL